jgi:hypothetical protein
MTVTANWNGAIADWNTPADWSDGIVPNDTNTVATLGDAGAYIASRLAERSSRSSLRRRHVHTPPHNSAREGNPA